MAASQEAKLPNNYSYFGLLVADFFWSILKDIYNFFFKRTKKIGQLKKKKTT